MDFSRWGGRVGPSVGLSYRDRRACGCLWVTERLRWYSVSSFVRAPGRTGPEQGLRVPSLSSRCASGQGLRRSHRSLEPHVCTSGMEGFYLDWRVRREVDEVWRQGIYQWSLYTLGDLYRGLTFDGCPMGIVLLIDYITPFSKSLLSLSCELPYLRVDIRVEEPSGSTLLVKLGPQTQVGPSIPFWNRDYFILFYFYILYTLRYFIGGWVTDHLFFTIKG